MVSESGNSAALNSLGDCYRYGKGIDKDEEKAYGWYLKSAENGNSLGKINVGYCLDFGIGIVQDKKLSI